MRKTYSSAFKAQLVLELLKETKTLNQLAAEHGIHPNLLRTWRELALKDFASLFERRDSLATAQADHAQQLEALYAEIGRLTTQVNF
jgi:transposase-like protein